MQLQLGHFLLQHKRWGRAKPIIPAEMRRVGLTARCQTPATFSDYGSQHLCVCKAFLQLFIHSQQLLILFLKLCLLPVSGRNPAEKSKLNRPTIKKTNTVQDGNYCALSSLPFRNFRSNIFSGRQNKNAQYLVSMRAVLFYGERWVAKNSKKHAHHWLALSNLGMFLFWAFRMPSGFGAALVAAVTVSLGSSLWPFLFVSAGKPLNTVTLMLRQFDFFA